MARKLERKWFPAMYGTRITLKKVDKWAETFKQQSPYFDTWEEARDWMESQTMRDMEHAMRRLTAAHRRLLAVHKLVPPV